MKKHDVQQEFEPFKVQPTDLDWEFNLPPCISSLYSLNCIDNLKKQVYVIKSTKASYVKESKRFLIKEKLLNPEMEQTYIYHVILSSTHSLIYVALDRILTQIFHLNPFERGKKSKF